MTRKIIAALMLSAIAASSTGAQTPSVARGARSPMLMDVAGVRLGLPSVQVAAALRGTYKCDVNANALTFGQKVDAEVDKRRGRSTWGREGTGANSAYCKGPNGEELKISYAQTANGDAVDSFSAYIPTTNVSREDLLRQVAAKYGRPTFGDPLNGCWAAVRGDCFVASDGPKFVVEDSGRSLLINAQRGRRARQVDEAAVLAAADRVAPKRSGAAF